jgi:hypothetical protein
VFAWVDCRKRLKELLNFVFTITLASRDSKVVRTNGHGLEGQGLGVRVPVEAIFFSFLLHLSPFRGPTSLLSNGGQRGRSVKPTTYIELVPRSRMY